MSQAPALMSSKTSPAAATHRFCTCPICILAYSITCKPHYVPPSHVAKCRSNKTTTPRVAPASLLPASATFSPQGAKHTSALEQPQPPEHWTPLPHKQYPISPHDLVYVTPEPSPTRCTPPTPPTPAFYPIPRGQLTAPGLNAANTIYAISHSRYSIAQLVCPDSKWHVSPFTDGDYEDSDSTLEEYEPVTGYVDVRESIEVEKKGKRSPSPTYGQGDNTAEELTWTGRVEYPESGVRTSIAREAKRQREGESEDGCSNGEDEVSRESKRVRRSSRGHLNGGQRFRRMFEKPMARLHEL